MTVCGQEPEPEPEEGEEGEDGETSDAQTATETTELVAPGVSDDTVGVSALDALAQLDRQVMHVAESLSQLMQCCAGVRGRV